MWGKSRAEPCSSLPHSPAVPLKRGCLRGLPPRLSHQRPSTASPTWPMAIGNHTELREMNVKVRERLWHTLVISTSQVVWGRPDLRSGGGWAWGQKSGDLSLNLPFVIYSTCIPEQNSWLPWQIFCIIFHKIGIMMTAKLTIQLDFLQ